MDAESLLEEVLLFLEMDRLQTRGNGSTRVATGVEDVTAVVVLGLVEQSLHTRLNVGPGTSVQGLFLTPDDVTGVGIVVEVLLQLSPREGMQLFDTGDGSVADAIGLTVLGESSVHLATANDHTLNLLGLVDGSAVGGIRDDPLEVAVTGELLDGRAGDRMTQERLGEEDNQSCDTLARPVKQRYNTLTFTELAVDLTTQDMEQVSRSSHVHDLHVDILVLALKSVSNWDLAGLLIAELQPALHPTGRVLRTLSIVAVGQRQNKTRALQPLGLSRGNELVDDALSVVGEVTELSFPHDKRIGRGQGVSVLETKTV